MQERRIQAFWTLLLSTAPLQQHTYVNSAFRPFGVGK